MPYLRQRPECYTLFSGGLFCSAAARQRASDRAHADTHCVDGIVGQTKACMGKFWSVGNAVRIEGVSCVIQADTRSAGSIRMNTA